MVKSILAFCLGVVGLVFAQTSAAQTPETLIRTSQYIFEGAVEKQHASNVALLPPSDRTVVVRVNNMLRAPKGMNFHGKEITLYLPRAGEARTGEVAVFFANGWLYGENLAMKQVGRLPISSAQDLKSTIAQVESKVADEALLLRMREADLVVQGKVMATKVMRGEEHKRSEHETDWAVAQVRVVAVLKGQVPDTAKTTPVYFPTSTDEFWYLSPKFSEGQEGTFILSAATARRYRLEGYTALDPLDFLTGKDSERAKALAQRLR
jgi:hypothetical protein